MKFWFAGVRYINHIHCYCFLSDLICADATPFFCFFPVLLVQHLLHFKFKLVFLYDLFQSPKAYIHPCETQDARVMLLHLITWSIFICYYLYLQHRLKERSTRPKDNSQFTSTAPSLEVILISVYF